MTRVIKIGGNEMNRPGFLDELARQIATLAGGEPLVVVHGGGQDIAALQSRLGIEPVKIDGLRVTDAESLAVAQMVLSGHTNKAIVVALLAAAVDAVGFSGVDGGLLRCRKKQHPRADLGLVGEIVAVRADFLEHFAGRGIVPVISPISLGEDGQTYNVNADHVAAALAHGLQASRLVFVTNVPGVLVAGRVVRALTVAQVEEMIAEGLIFGGMIPKVRSAIEAVAAGVYQAVITDLDGLAQAGGTIILNGTMNSER